MSRMCEEEDIWMNEIKEVNKKKIIMNNLREGDEQAC